MMFGSGEPQRACELALAEQRRGAEEKEEDEEKEKDKEEKEEKEEEEEETDNKPVEALTFRWGKPIESRAERREGPGFVAKI